ncbi:hypothetical protein EJ08DRAFT_693810 [Tothia fuscella]|uniref:Chromo domain-containing protein n=1 Tax=Tothia fuscella TaxID=1048955 RepID=A0A9P4NZ27_9PEZI|nr:hypothetical protein EJ08DRAFT_693810 [Tothia fuscella]
MPPLVVDDDDDEQSGEEIPYKDPSPEEEAGDEEGSEDDEGDEEVFVVEAITDHNYDDNGVLIYLVRWQGYPKKSDHTWEPEENLATAKETLEEYFKKIGGRPSANPEKRSKKRKTEDVETPKPGRKKTKTETPEVAPGSTRKKKQVEWKPPMGTWEDDLMDIDTIEETKNSKGELERAAYVVWNNGQKTRHSLATLNMKAPQKMLRYYESHLVFKTDEVMEEKLNGDSGENADTEVAAEA